MIPNITRMEAAMARLGDHQVLTPPEPGAPAMSLYQPQLHPLGHRRAVLAAVPPPRLDLPEHWPPLNLVLAGTDLVSRRLRDVLALAEDDAFYGPVDERDAPATVRRAGYRLFCPLQWADPIDHARTRGHHVFVPGPDGAWTTEWRMRFGNGPLAPPNPVFWRDGFVPPAPVFAIPGLPGHFVTDELAARVAAAGFPDIEFLDISGPQSFGDLRLRR